MMPMRALLLTALLLLPGVLSASQGEGAPRLVVEVDNRGEAARARIDIRTSFDVAEPPTYSAMIDLPPGETIRHPTPLREGYWFVTFQVLPISFPNTYGIHSDGCVGDFVVSFASEVSGASVSTSSLAERSGCTVVPPSARDAALVQPSGDGEVRIPWPGAQDVGQFLSWRRYSDPTWAEADPIPFAWHPGLDVLDADGRALRADELEYLAVGERSSVAVLATSDTATTEGITDVLRYEPGALRPFAYSFEGTGAVGSVSEHGVTSETSVDWVLRYADPASLLACLVRNGIQGRGLRVGERLDGADVCPTLGGAWVAVEAGEIEGLRTLTLARETDVTDDGFRASRIVIADGVAYPVSLETWSQPEGLVVRHAAWKLVGAVPGGEPLASEATPRAPAPPASAPIDAMRGPSGGTFPFPLATAVDSALADPTLAQLHQVTSAPGAALEHAAMAEHARGGWVWYLSFVAGPTREGAMCERLDAAPVVRCRGSSAPPFATDDAAPLGPGALPATGASWDGAEERFLVHAPDAGPPTRAWYEPGARLVGVGTGPPYDPFPLPVAPVTSTTRLVLLDLATGRTAQDASVVARTSAIVGIPDVIAPRGELQSPRPSGLPATPASIVALAAVAGLAFLGLLGFFLYTRLLAARVLDDETRRRIHDLVREEPGIHAAGVMQRLDKATGVSKYHLRVLVRESVLACVQTPGFRRYFIAGRYSPNEMRALAALRDGHCEKVFRIIQETPGIHLTALAMRADLSLPQVSRTVKQLALAGLVDKVEQGRQIGLHAIEN